MAAGCGWLLLYVMSTALSPSSAMAVEPHPDWVNSLRPGGSGGPELTLASDGTARYVILLSAEPTAQDRKAADELAHWLGQISGAEFAIQREQAGQPAPARVISIGRTELLSEAQLPCAGTELGKDGYAIAVKDEALFIIGGRRRGPMNGVYALLEEDIGCRWYVRGMTTIPHALELIVKPVPRVSVPQLDRREAYYSDALGDLDWSLRNRLVGVGVAVPQELGGSPRAVPSFVHTYASLVPQGEYFDEHPEYYSLVDGKRRSSQLCMTNQAVRRIIVKRVLELLEQDPAATAVDISPNDGKGYCQCEPCKAVDDAEGTRMGTLLAVVNAVADEVAKVRPDVMVQTLAYLDTGMPPKTIRPRPNVQVVLCTDRHAWGWLGLHVTETDEFNSWLKAWSELNANIVIWDYTIGFGRYLRPIANMPVVGQNLRYYAAQGVKGVFLQAQHQPTYGVDRALLRCWVWSKQLWDPSRNTRDLMRDFTYGFYGRAAEPMHAYNEMMWRIWERHHLDGFQRRNRDWEVMYDAAFAERAVALMEQAEQLAGDDAGLLRRVRLAKLPVLFVKAVLGPDADTDAYLQVVDEIEAIAKAENVSSFEDGLRPSDAAKKLAQWRSWAQVIGPETLAAIPVGPVWRFKPDPNNAGVDDAWFDAQMNDDDWATVRTDVGEGWTAQGFAHYRGYGWYRTRLVMPKDFDRRKQLWLFFEGIQEGATIYIDGKKVFEHSHRAAGIGDAFCWNTPARFDVRDHLKPGVEHLIAIHTDGPLDRGGVWGHVNLISADTDANVYAVRTALQRAGG